MTLELKMLALSIVLGLVQIILASHAASLQRGYIWTASSRDDTVPKLTGVAGRLPGSTCCYQEMPARLGHHNARTQGGVAARPQGPVLFVRQNLRPNYR